jgi:hypothetical protein
MDCRDCVYCKFTQNRTRLFCTKDQWFQYYNGEQEIVKTSVNERSSLHIMPRIIFHQCRDCRYAEEGMG